ncbi:G-type lectin S-receptor-like serine/threonine-protein kinase At2g19130 [Fagus crenata]
MSLKAHLSTASDTLYPGQILSGNQTLTSKSGIFELGFFTLDKSLNYYIGIWYKKIAEKTVVWVANRQNPVSDPYSSAIQLYKDGYYLVLREKGNVSHHLISSLNSQPNSTIGSFDQPTNTWLPGAKIEYDRLNNESTTILISWTSLDNPAYEYLQDGEFYAELYGGNVSLKDLNNQYIKVSYVYNNNESYFIYSAVSPSTFPRFVLNDLRKWDLVWMAIPQRCKILGFCGDSGICNQQKVPVCDYWDLYYYSKGCERRNPLQCSQGGIDTFLTIPNMRFPEASSHPTVKSIEECKLICLSDCFCNAYTYYNECGIYWGPLMNLQQLSSDNEFGRDFHVRISTSELLVESRNKISKKAALIVGVPSVLIFLIGIVLAIIWRAHSIGALEEVEFSLILFKYQDIRRATKNFSQKLGEDSFGTISYYNWDC